MVDIVQIAKLVKIVKMVKIAASVSNGSFAIITLGALAAQGWGFVIVFVGHFVILLMFWYIL